MEARDNDQGLGFYIARLAMDGSRNYYNFIHTTPFSIEPSWKTRCVNLDADLPGISLVHHKKHDSVLPER